MSKTASESTPAPSSSERRVAIDDEYPNDEEDVLNALEEDRQYFEEVERLVEKVEEIGSRGRIKFPREHEQAKFSRDSAQRTREHNFKIQIWV